jgi:hypothetical protein
MRFLLIAVLLLGPAACDGVQRGSDAVTVCQKAGQRCQLPSQGPLGICNDTPCAAGQLPPCLRCVPQH